LAPSSSAEGKRKLHIVVSEEFEDEDDSSAFMVFVGDRPSDDGWYLDGGATDHMTDHLEWFTSITMVQSNCWLVMIVDNRKLWVQGVGSIEVQCKLGDKWEPRVFRRVLYVPDLCKNLFFVGQAADKGYVTTYT
jgi:hypothetical protein